MTRRLMLLAALAAPGPLSAQGLPAYFPLNPAAAARTALGFEPYRSYRGRGWTVAADLDYGSAIEHNLTSRASYDLDAELLRVRLRAGRDLSRTAFVQFDAEAGGSYAGFLDGVLNWYHRLLGLDLPERDRRPNNSFLWEIAPEGGRTIERRPSDLFLGDVRLGAGLRLTPELQALATVTLPTNTGPDGYGRGVVAGGVIATIRAPLARPLAYEGSLGVGLTGRHGDLSAWQRTTMVSGSSGLRWRFWGRQSLYGNVFYHRPYYDRTGIPALDRRELSFDFGWILATRSGKEWRIGMTEDLEPGGPGIDLIFRLGRS